MQTINWKIEGITCSNCALTISKYLEKEGLKNVRVNPLDGETSFDTELENGKEAKLSKGIAGLGYRVADNKANTTGKNSMNPFLAYLLFCLPFTLILMLHMFNAWLPVHWLMNPWVQLTLCVPVYLTGMYHFGTSAVRGLLHRSINMNVLITIGATAAFVYSLIGTISNLGEGFIFYETTATIITLVFLGNYLEEKTIASTQKALNGLVKSQKVMANIIGFDENHQEIIFPLDNTLLKPGDLILIKSGEQVPADCKILWGDAEIDESIITGESLPLHKTARDLLIGGSLVADGNLRAQVTTAAGESILSNIINLVKKAQSDKPPLQLVADKISAVFVPVVLGIAMITFLANYYVLELTVAMMRSIAVLVIACPCAMGLATPAAIAVGLGRAARNGVLFRNAKSLENFSGIKQVIFDKTGTLTTGKFRISGYKSFSTDDNTFKSLLYSMEKFSNHPVAKVITSEWKSTSPERFQKIEEIKGLGMRAETKEGDILIAGSYSVAEKLTAENNHSIYLVRNGVLTGWIDLEDTIRPESGRLIRYLRNKNIKTILLSGDRLANCNSVARNLGIDEVYAEQTPQQKLEKVAALSAGTPTAMVGDGINDAPALAKATIGISLSDSSQIAMQTADVVLMNNSLKNLPLALGLGRHTFITIRQNLFWAFAYNVVAIPVAALGYLTPAIAALVMGLSDVVLAINSIRLYYKNVEK
ncbi:MAG: cation-translocating P-type ATPase [Chitinophagaceae bacterium]